MENEKKEINWRKERSLIWFILLYPENDHHQQALELIEKNYSEYAWVQHVPENDEKKEHIHVIVRFKNYRWNTALAEELGVEINMFEKCRSLENGLLYLVHAREENKIHYSLDDVHGTLKSKLERFLKSDGKDSIDKAVEIVNWINSQGYITINQLFTFATVSGLYSELVRALPLFRDILYEHNSRYE